MAFPQNWLHHIDLKQPFATYHCVGCHRNNSGGVCPNCPPKQEEPEYVFPQRLPQLDVRPGLAYSSQLGTRKWCKECKIYWPKTRAVPRCRFEFCNSAASSECCGYCRKHWTDMQHQAYMASKSSKAGAKQEQESRRQPRANRNPLDPNKLNGLPGLGEKKRLFPQPYCDNKGTTLLAEMGPSHAGRYAQQPYSATSSFSEIGPSWLGYTQQSRVNAGSWLPSAASSTQSSRLSSSFSHTSSADISERYRPQSSDAYSRISTDPPRSNHCKWPGINVKGQPPPSPSSLGSSRSYSSSHYATSSRSSRLR